MELMHRTDTKAMQVMAIYLAVISALGAQSMTLYYAKNGPIVGLYFFTGTAFALLVGAGLAFRALWTVDVYLAGRKPDFWLWALDNGVGAASAIRSYLDQAARSIDHNDKKQERAAKSLRLSYLSGLVSPLFGLAAVSLWNICP